jgi:hypothetical protein
VNCKRVAVRSAACCAQNVASLRCGRFAALPATRLHPSQLSAVATLVPPFLLPVLLRPLLRPLLPGGRRRGAGGAGREAGASAPEPAAPDPERCAAPARGAGDAVTAGADRDRAAGHGGPARSSRASRCGSRRTPAASPSCARPSAAGPTPGSRTPSTCPNTRAPFTAIRERLSPQYASAFHRSLSHRPPAAARSHHGTSRALLHQGVLRRASLRADHSPCCALTTALAAR